MGLSQSVLCSSVLPITVAVVRAAFHTHIHLCEESRSQNCTTFCSDAMYLSPSMCSCAHTKICVSKQLNFCCRTIEGQSLNQGLHLKELHNWSLLLNFLKQHVLYISCLIYHVCLKIKANTWCIVVYKWVVEAIGYLFTEMKENLTIAILWCNAGLEMMPYQCARSVSVVVFVPAPSCFGNICPVSERIWVAESKELALAKPHVPAALGGGTPLLLGYWEGKPQQI